MKTEDELDAEIANLFDDVSRGISPEHNDRTRWHHLRV